MNATLLSAALLCVMAPPVESAGAPQTLLYVRMMPSGAQILLDGKPLGTSDGLFPGQPGQYQIVVDLEGHQPRQQEITVRDGRITRIELTLAKGPAAEITRPEPKPGKAGPLSGVSFGPVIGLPLKDPGEGLVEVFDLDTGKRGTMKSTGRIDANTARQMRDRGMDLFISRLRKSPLWQRGPSIWLFDAVRWEEPNPGSSPPTPEAIPMLMRLKPETSSLRGVGAGDVKMYYFKTREGAIGAIALVASEGPDFVMIRCGLVQKTGAQSPAPAQQPAVAGFGPAIERVVSDDRAGKDWFIDLDKGVLHTPPADVDRQRKPMEMLQWARREGIDASGVKAGEGFLFGIDLQVAAIDGASWDDVDPARVASAMRDEPNTSVKDAKDQPALMVGGAGRGPSALYGFRTREGGMGVLQVIGVTDDPKGLKIRYKLIQATGPERAVAPQSGGWEADSGLPTPFPAHRGQPKETVIKTVHLAEVETRDAEVVLDLASGQTLKISDRKEGLAQFARLGKGDLFFVRDGTADWIGCLRGDGPYTVRVRSAKGGADQRDVQL